MHYPYGEAWWWQQLQGMFFRDWETSQDREKDEQSKVQRSLMKTCSAPVLRFIFQQDNALKNTAKTTLEWLQDKSLNVLEWQS